MSVIISGFGDYDVNGLYTDVGIFNGETIYHKLGTNYWLLYYTSWMPWSAHEGYYIVEIFSIPNTLAVPLQSPRYAKFSNDLMDATPWTSMVAQSSGAYTTGTVTDEMSSSSSESSSTSSSTSESTSSSESSPGP